MCFLIKKFFDDDNKDLSQIKILLLNMLKLLKTPGLKVFGNPVL